MVKLKPKRIMALFVFSYAIIYSLDWAGSKDVDNDNDHRKIFDGFITTNTKPISVAIEFIK